MYVTGSVPQSSAFLAAMGGTPSVTQPLTRSSGLVIAWSKL